MDTYKKTLFLFLSVGLLAFGLLGCRNESYKARAYSGTAALNYQQSKMQKEVSSPNDSVNKRPPFKKKKKKESSPKTPPVVIGMLDFDNAKKVISKSCSSCHGAGASAGDFSSQKEEDFVSSGLIVPGRPDQSALIRRLRHFGAPESNMPPKVVEFSKQDYDVLVAWVQNMESFKEKAPKKDVSIKKGKSEDFQCSGKPESKPKDHFKRLTKAQYRNTLNSIIRPIYKNPDEFKIENLKDFKGLIDQIPEEDTNKHAFESFDQTLSQLHVETYFTIGLQLADFLSREVAGTGQSRFAHIVKAYSKNKEHYECLSYRKGYNVDCFKNAIRIVGLRVQRRPLSEEDVQHYINMVEKHGSQVKRIRALGGYLFNSPRFLFRVEDQGKLVHKGEYKLDSYELISKLTYTLWNDMPDSELFNMAKKYSNLQGNKNHFDLVVSYILSKKEKVNRNLKRFYDGYLGLSHIPNLTEPIVESEKRAFAHFLNGVTVKKSSLKQEIYDLMEHYTWSEPSPFSTTLTTRLYFAKSKDLAQIYGDSNRIWKGSPVHNLKFKSGERSGILTRAAFLFGGGRQTSPIHRGVRVVKKILCQTLPMQPTLSQDDLTVSDDAYRKTTRKQVHDLTMQKGSSCVGCHTKINPFGYAFEKFDSLGRIRPDQKETIYDLEGKAIAEVGVDSSASVSINYSDYAVTGSEQLSMEIKESGLADMCYSKNIYAFTQGRKPSLKADSCDLKEINATLKSEGMLEALKTLVSLKSFRHRRI